MADDTFEGFVEKERARLTKARETLLTKQTELQDQIDNIDREMRAIDAYTSTKAGKLPTRSSTSGGKGRRGGKREELLALIKDTPGGASRGDLLERLQLKGDKAGEQSVSNALSALKRAGTLKTNGSKYLIA